MAAMPAAEVFCSTIIPTIGRDSVGRAVESVLNQTFRQPFEVIVVNDSGRTLPPADWQQAGGVRVIETMQRERSVARNVGAAVARGRYLHFLDDDDWLLPGALDVFWSLAENCPAAWLYGAAQLIDNHGRCLFQFDHQLSGNCLTQAMAGEWVPLQASLVAASAFFAVGGFNPSLSGAEDKELLMRVALRCELAGTATPVAGILRGTWNSSTDWSKSTHNWHVASEHMLSEAGTAARMRASADDAYWHGRWLRVYLLSAWWNARQRRPLALLGRLSHGAGVLLLAGPRLFSGSFWRALTHAHLTKGFDPTSQAGEPAPHQAGSRRTG